MPHKRPGLIPRKASKRIDEDDLKPALTTSNLGSSSITARLKLHAIAPTRSPRLTMFLFIISNIQSYSVQLTRGAPGATAGTFTPFKSMIWPRPGFYRAECTDFICFACRLRSSAIGYFTPCLAKCLTYSSQTEESHLLWK